MLKYVRVFLNTIGGTQPATRSVSTGCVIAQAASGPTGKFLLTKPAGDEFDTITVNSDLYNAIVSFYSQRNARELWCVRYDSSNNSNITGEVLSPLTNGVRTEFQLQMANITNLGELRLDDVALTPVAGSPGADEYSISLAAGTVTLGEAPDTGSILEADYTIDALQSAFMDVRDEDIALMCLGGDWDLSTYMTLVDEMVKASAAGRYRMCQVALPSGQALTREYDEEGYRYSEWPAYLESERCSLIAHKIPESANEDAAAALMGTIASVRINKSLTAENVVCTQNSYFTPSETYSMTRRGVIYLDRMQANETAKRISYGTTLSPTSSTKYIDQIRVYDDLAFTVEATVNSPLVIGTLPYNTPGLTTLSNYIRAAVEQKVRFKILEKLNYINIPQLTLSQLKDQGRLTEAEEIEFRQYTNSRYVSGVEVGFDYRGAIEGVEIYLIP